MMFSDKLMQKSVRPLRGQIEIEKKRMPYFFTKFPQSKMKPMMSKEKEISLPGRKNPYKFKQIM